MHIMEKIVESLFVFIVYFILMIVCFWVVYIVLEIKDTKENRIIFCVLVIISTILGLLGLT
ncbi:hypothetical protein DXB27_24420 [Parabacteroides gordonii]|jgi:uncharacterized membrane protein HdeD (DUF308 family)|nr:hypothetical protein DXB27_24420 [Parabacteroides gordonii]